MLAHDTFLYGSDAPEGRLYRAGEEPGAGWADSPVTAALVAALSPSPPADEAPPAEPDPLDHDGDGKKGGSLSRGAKTPPAPAE